MKLTAELVPKPLFYKNLRAILSRNQWDLLRRAAYQAAGHRCEICGASGRMECHERWEYNDNNHIQTLEGLLSLCNSCHRVKHLGKAQLDGVLEEAVAHLMKVNCMSEDMAWAYVDASFERWGWRSEFEWEQDLSWLGKEADRVL